MKIFRRSLIFSSLARSISRGVRTTPSSAQHYKVVVVGGGTGGLAVANRLTSFVNPTEIVIIEPSDIHYYQALWTLVGAGIKPMKESVRPMTQVLPRDVRWIQDRLTGLNATDSTIHTETGLKVTYDNLVLSLGINPRFDLIPGALEALKSDSRVLSNYSADYVEKTFKAYQSFKGGQAVFTLPVGPVKCAGAPQKVMYLFEDHLRRTGRRDSAQILYFTALPAIFSVEKYAERLTNICRHREIEFHLQHNLVRVSPSTSEVVVENLVSKETRIVHYDLLHITPPMTIPSVLTATPKLTNQGLVDVDSKYLRHNHYPNVWALGDCSSLPTSKTAASISAQAAVLCKNLRSVLSGGSANVSEYDGYTSCPIVTGYSHGILAEFDYSRTPLETFPFDQGNESRLFYFIKTEVLPPLYWDWFIQGMWSGPKFFRKLFRLGLSK